MNTTESKYYLLGQAVRMRLMAGMREPVAYLYNGVRLPGLPETELPYLVIILNEDDGNYYLGCFDYKKTAYADGKVSFTSFMADELYVSANGRWTVSDATFTGTRLAVWVNYDLYYTEGIENVGGTLCLAKSDPVPVYD